MMALRFSGPADREEGRVYVPDAALVDRRLTPRDIDVLAWLDRMRANGQAAVSVRELGELMGCSEQTVHRSRRRLAAAGYLEVSR